MKAIELPINTLIVIILAIIVLVAVIALFYTGLTPKVVISSKNALDNACMRMLNFKCNIDSNTILINNFDADNDGTSGDVGSWTWGTSNCGGNLIDNGDNLASLCACYYQISGATPEEAERNCKSLCQC